MTHDRYAYIYICIYMISAYTRVYVQ